jgi:hypothetical protein
MNFTTKSENNSSSFNTVEYAKGSIFDRHIFTQINSAITPNPKEELYQSPFLYSPSVEIHFTTTPNNDSKNTLTGYDYISIGKIVTTIFKPLFSSKNYWFINSNFSSIWWDFGY